MGGIANGLGSLTGTPGQTAEQDDDRVSSQEGGIGGIFKNAFRDLKDIALGVGTLAGAVGTDIAKGVGTVATLGQVDFDFKTDDIVKAIPKAIAGDYGDRYGELFHGDLAGFAEEMYQSPLSFISDALTIATAGGSVAATAAGNVAKVGKVGTAAKTLGAIDVASEVSLLRQGALSLDEVSRAAKFVESVQGTATKYINPITRRIETIDPLRNPARRSLYQNPVLKRIMDNGAPGHKLAEQLADEALKKGPAGLEQFTRAMELRKMADEAINGDIPVMKTWVARAKTKKAVDRLFGATRASARKPLEDLARTLERELGDLPDGIDEEAVVQAITGQDGTLVNDGYTPRAGRGTRRGEVFDPIGPGTLEDPMGHLTWERGAQEALPTDVDEAITRRTFDDPTISAIAEKLDDIESPLHEGFRQTLAEGKAKNLGNGLYSEVDDNGITTVFQMEGDAAKGYLQVTDDGHYLAATATSSQGQGIGKKLLKQYWRDKGINTPERVAAEINRQSLSGPGSALMRSVAKDVLGPRADSAIALAERYAPEADLEAVHAARNRALADTTELTPALREEFGPGVVVPGGAKSPAAIAEKAALTGDWRNLDDISRFRVVDPDVFTKVGKAEETIRRIEKVTGGSVRRIENTIGTPDADGSRQLRLVVESPDGHPIEFQLVTPAAAEVLDATSSLRRHMAGLTRLIDEGGPEGPARMLELEKAKRLNQQVWEGVTSEIREGRGGHADSAMRKKLHALRVAVHRDLTDPAVAGGLPVSSAFDNAYMPLRLQNGAEWADEAGKTGELRGVSPLELDDLGQQAGDMAPLYYPMVDARRLPRRGDFLLKSPGNSVARMVEDQNLRKNSGYLLKEDLYSKDFKKVYRVRAQRAARAAESRALTTAVLSEYSRRVTDWTQKADDEVMWSPQVMNALWRTERASDDAAMRALQEGLDEGETVSDALVRTIGVNQDQAARIFRDQDVELYAVPKVVAQRIQAQMKVQFGESAQVLFNTPTQLWKSLVLSGSPRWVVNNVLGNTAFLKLQGGRLSDVVRQLNPRFRARLKEAIGPQLDKVDSKGFYDEMAKDVRAYSEETLAGSVANRVQQSSKVNTALALPRKLGDFMHKVNGGVEDAFRRASYLKAAERAVVQGEVKAVGLGFWNSKKRLDQVFRVGLDEKAAGLAVDEVNKFLNDYTAMTPFGRNILRPYVVPFFGFYRHASKMLLGLPFEHPGKATLLRLVNEVADDQRDAVGELPSWMEGMLPLGPGDAGDMRFLSTAGANPFNTVMEAPMQLLHPMWKMVYEHSSGRSAYTGRQFTDEGVVKPYGSDQQYRMNETTGKMEPIERVTPGLFQHVMQQVPQYDIVRDILAPGSTYDTAGISDLLQGKGVIRDPETGEPLYPKDKLVTLGRLFGYSETAFDVDGYQDRRATEMEQALTQYLARIATPKTSTAPPGLSSIGV